MELQVLMVELNEVVELRHFVLRPHQDIQNCIYESDTEPRSFHVGAYLDGKLVSIASFNEERLEGFKVSKQYRLRAMATLPEYRKLGAGSRIVKFAEDILKQNGIELLWCKGRTNARGYYLNLGFNEYGEEFDYPPIGMHILMVKKL